jgi:predicted ATPase
MRGEPRLGRQQPGGLLGRAAETAAIGRALDSARLVTVTGLPGVGKTAVSLGAASAAAGNFADGHLVLRLDGLRDEALLPHTVGAALRLPDEFTRSRLDVLADQLRDRHLLLVLDTCEHLLGACAALVAALLPPCPKMQVLATSREPLRVPGGATVAVRPLRLADAVGLFGQRAAQAGIEFAPRNRAAVASACVQLDKLPLAIELAAAELGQQARDRGPTRQLAELMGRLEAGHDLGLAGREPGRHQSLRAAIGWSHELCTPSERLLWARLSVFTGPFGRQDAQDVCAGADLPDESVAAGLRLLAERSVLLADRRAGGAAGGRRYLLPVTLRAYGGQMLRRLGQDAEFAARHRYWQDRCRGQGAPA